MAITRAQQYKQMLQKGGRTGFRVGSDEGDVSGREYGGSSKGLTSREERRGGQYTSPEAKAVVASRGGDSPNIVVPPPKPEVKKTIREKFVPPIARILSFLGDKFSKSKFGMLNNALQRQNYLRTLSPEEQVEVLEDLAIGAGIGTTNPMGIDRNIERGMEDDGFLGTGIGGGKFITDIDFGGPEAKAVLGKGYTEYLKEQRERFTPDDRDGPDDPCRGPNPPAYCFTGIRSAAPVVEEPEYVNPLSLLTPRIAGSQFAADGGRAGFRGAGAVSAAYGDAAAKKGPVERPGGGGEDGPKGPPRVINPPPKTKPDPTFFDKTKALATVPLNLIGGLFGNPFDPKEPIQVINTKAQKDYLDYLANQKEDDTGVLSYDDYGIKFNLSDLKDPIAFSTAMTMGGTGFKKADTGDITYTGGTYDFDGAVPFIDSGGLMGLAYKGGEFLGDKLKPAKLAGGGMASLDREAFLLGGIAKGLKKAVRGIKKLAKSPIGKAALAFAALQYGGGFGAGLKSKLFGTPALVGSGRDFYMGMGGKSAATKGILGALGLTGGGGSMMPTALGGITLASLIAGATTPKEDKDKFDLAKYYGDSQLEPSQSIRGMGSEFDFYGGERMRVAEGGSTEKEPVAKKTMPLLDMDGMEKDYREEGGFVPIGRMEKADDVPARLSKNEFVFTADAVRNAGDGDVDKGAEVMYNMMKNLESGGDVSEESQGLEGAREMFQTSQRLGEVI